jgi:hypothetical protein
MKIDALLAQVANLLGNENRAWLSELRVEILSADGSSRRFYRLSTRSGSQSSSSLRSLLAILPPPQAKDKEMAEAASVAKIGRHLHALGAPTPAIYAWNATNGLVLCEDFGDKRLHNSATGPGQQLSRMRLYEESLQALARMQVRAAQGFDPSWCWDNPCFDASFMQERESGYFLRACCRDLLNISFDDQTLAEECRHLAEQAAQAPAHYFLHRDFQSRNIMLPQGRPAFIDFQGGRLGPLAYDVASLLIDPYAALPASMQAELLNVYLKALNRETSYDPQQFYHEYLLLAAHRNMQILGAFAFLSQVKGKPFFTRYLRPAAVSLATLLAKAEFARYAGLRQLSRQCCQQLDTLL